MDRSFIHEVELKIAQWAKNKPAVQSVIELGSQARKDHPADRWSDLDLILLIDAPISRQEKNKWINEISSWVGNVWSIAEEPGTSSGWFPLGTIISGKLKIDFVGWVYPDLSFQSQNLEDILPEIHYSYVFYPSCRVIYDLHGIPREISQPSGRYIPQIPDEADFINFIRHFWMELVHVAQLFNRGERWHATHLLNSLQEKYLLKLIEWYSTIFRDQGKIWPGGRFLEEWAAPRIVTELESLQRFFPGEVFWDSFFKMIDLQRQITFEICIKKAYQLPDDEIGRFRSWLIDLSSSSTEGKPATNIPI